MQAEIQTKVKISVSEIKKILAEKFCLYHDFEVEIVDDSANKENNDWIDVPKDWGHHWCPTNLNPSTKIDVILRNGVESHNIPVIHIGRLWSQDNYSADVVKYRVSKQSN